MSNWFTEQLAQDTPGYVAPVARPIILPPMARPTDIPTYQGSPSFPQTYDPRMTNQVVAPTKAISAHQRGRCPACGSGNYMTLPDGRIGARCFDCGHTDGDRIPEQAGSQVSVTGTGQGKATPTRQVAQPSSAGGFTIIGSVPGQR